VRKLITVGLLLAVLAVPVWPERTFASHYIGAKWGGNAANQLTVYDSITNPAWSTAIQRAVGLWNQSAQVQMAYQRVAACPYGARAICTVEQTPGCWSYANIVIDHGRIQSPVIIVWGTDGCGGQEQFPGYYDYTACHELGHALGLDHRFGELGTCMSGGVFVDGEFVNTNPDAHDYAELDAIY
jgi:hypothetical protein